MRLIDADAEVKALNDFYHRMVDPSDKIAVLFAQDVLRNAPTIDAVPVVRCKDCVHSEIHRVRDGLFSETDVRKCEMCAFLSTVVDDDDFCSLGQRKEA